MSFTFLSRLCVSTTSVPQAFLLDLYVINLLPLLYSYLQIEKPSVKRNKIHVGS